MTTKMSTQLWTPTGTSTTTPVTHSLNGGRNLRAHESRLSRRVQSVPPSGIRRYFDIAATMEDVISLGIGEPDFVTPPPILQAGINSLQAGHTAYTSNAGMIELRRAVGAKLAELYGAASYDPEKETLITVGVSEAMYLIMQAILDPGDEVIVPQPCFVSYTASVLLAGGTVVDIPTYAADAFQVRPADIEAAITPRTKALLIGFPSNPTGAVMDEAGLLELARIAERHDLIVISDEIYDRLVYGGHRHVMFAALPGMKDRTVHLGGMSKDYAMTGWRIGYALGPADLIGAMRKVHQYLIMSASTTGQEAALEALTNPAVEDYVQQMVASYDQRRRLIVKGLNEIGLDCFEPKGAFYAFPSVAKTGMDEHEFAERLLREERVAVIPGSAFGRGGEGHVRCAYAASQENIEKALERMYRFMRRHG
ncbi:MAG TPA: aminotransferase class I/II-fold pyridoxal phosphate-dependent enzyme [Caldilineaceae bacterium]|nr:aminotransferase class I/II-fold pyridoxal phosphate-dependent enzyme [Caldilineaceae bacterium]